MSEVNIKQTLIDMVKAIVDEPDEVNVLQVDDGDNITLELNVAPDDMGKIIGRHGRVAKALRMVMKAVANTMGKKISIDIK